MSANKSAGRAGAGLVLLAGVSAWLSYASVRSVAIGIFGMAGGSAFPVLLDTGVYVASEYYLSSVRSNRPQHGFRALAHALVAVTVALNVSAATDYRAAMFHAVPPLVFAALVELRARQELGDVRAAQGRPDRIPFRLWIVNPIESAKLSLWAARQGSLSTVRTARERQLTALRALAIAVPDTKGDKGRAKLARGLVARQLRAGSLDPRALVEATGLDQITPTPGAESVLRVALISALGAPSARTSRRTGAGQSASADLVLPAARRTRGPENPNPGRSIDELRADALTMHLASVQGTGKPVSMRALKDGLGIGQARATELRDWLTAQPVVAVNGTH
ncbi:MAG TPA: DUF2637 domain-containing protein [Actinospica sp.]|nr:DUF2637 domain-containing protein [Actinospica sp.]